MLLPVLYQMYIEGVDPRVIHRFPIHRRFMY